MFCLESALALATRQHGSVSVAQLIDLGATVEITRHLVRSGQWIRVSPMVLRRAGAPRTRAQELVEAALDAGLDAAISHLPAAEWWRLNVKPGGCEVTRPRGSTSTPARFARLHEPRLFPPHHRTVFRGVPVTVPTRIPFDVAATLPSQAEKVLDRAWAKGLLSYQSSMLMLDELAERGRTGIAQMRELLAARGPEYRPNDTNLEDRFQELARQAGIHDLVRQRHLFGREWLGRVDFLWAARRRVIEVHSALYHDALTDQEADAVRAAALTEAGYAVDVFKDSDMWFDPAGTVARLRQIRRSGT